MGQDHPDARMNATITERKPEFHAYIIKWKSTSGERFQELWQEWFTNSRHRAIQFYTSKRKELKDFAIEPENYLVRFFCDGVEYLCDQEQWPQGWRDRGKSCRQLTGAVRPFPWERQIP